MSTGVRKACGVALAAAILLCLLAATSQQARATFPGRPGLIVFSLVNLPNPAGPYTGGLHAITLGQGPPRQLTTNPRDNDPSFSPSGDQIVFRRVDTAEPGIHMLDLGSGAVTRLLTREDDLNPTFGRRGAIAFLRFSHRTYSYDLFLRERDGRLRQLTSTGATEGEPVFTPDGKRIVFTRTYGGGDFYSESQETEKTPPPALFSIGVDGSGLRRIGDVGQGANFDVSPNGRRLAFSVFGAVTEQGSKSKTWTKRLNGGDLNLVSDNAWYPSFSPAGGKIAYTNYEGLWMRRADGRGGRTLLLAAEYKPFEAKGTLVIQPAWQPLP